MAPRTAKLIPSDMTTDALTVTPGLRWRWKRRNESRNRHDVKTQYDSAAYIHESPGVTHPSVWNMNTTQEKIRIK